MTESRKQFEEWAEKEDFDTDYGSYSESEYDSLFTQIAWESWQASRAAVVVKIPKCHYYDFDYDELYDALDEAGVSYE